jgi:hypothetical protein
VGFKNIFVKLNKCGVNNTDSVGATCMSNVHSWVLWTNNFVKMHGINSVKIRYAISKKWICKQYNVNRNTAYILIKAWDINGDLNCRLPGTNLEYSDSRRPAEPMAVEGIGCLFGRCSVACRTDGQVLLPPAPVTYLPIAFVIAYTSALLWAHTVYIGACYLNACHYWSVTSWRSNCGLWAF